MQVIKPDLANKHFASKEKSIFLAGSIENNLAWDWQKVVEKALENFTNLTIYNPRRDDWNPNWVQSMNNKDFNDQVNWELEMLEKSDIIFMYQI